ncbi:hypothetical protein H9Q13_02600 [Pontibacter sp. JH31]|uniref:Lipoprotein n=1 Tax=Pontibacter aquaedesilientis TaxID=2766980 RepID=A0ABR7XCL6_9BACT|nr:hypothetical protein [Pontibacter aquaedesilientis]MBD1396042.1 hypothetical protein [Pontibacter aquaedesilientis]
MRKVLLLLVVLAGFLAACENKYKDPDPTAMGFDYYPLEVGNYRIYDVTDIKITRNVSEINRFQLRERVDTSFYDQTNQLVHKIVRSVRANSNRPWVDDSVMTVIKSTSKVLLTKDNTKYVKLVFPVKAGLKWEGDAFNSRVVNNGKESYTYGEVGETFEIDGQSFAKTVTVTQGTPFDNVQLDNRKEVYAEGIGLVYRLFNRAVYCAGSEIKDCPVDDENFKQSGHERHEVLVEHGKL